MFWEGVDQACLSRDCYDSRRRVDSSVPEDLDIRGRDVPVDMIRWK